MIRRRKRAVSSVVEHLAFNQLVDGSIPSRPTISRRATGRFQNAARNWTQILRVSMKPSFAR